MMIFSCHKIPKFAAPGGGAACLWSIYSRPQIKKIHKKQCLLQMIWLLFMLTTRLTQQSAYLFI